MRLELKLGWGRHQGMRGNGRIQTSKQTMIGRMEGSEKEGRREWEDKGGRKEGKGNMEITECEAVKSRQKQIAT